MPLAPLRTIDLNPFIFTIMLTIADKTFRSRLFLGTGKFASPDLMARAVEASGSELVTLALKRVELQKAE